MKLACLEVLRRGSRYAPIVAALALIVFLILALAAFADGLFSSASGAIRNTGGDLIVFSEDGRRSLTRSHLPEADAQRVAAVEGVAAVGPVGALLGHGAGPGGELRLAVFGFRPGLPGGPSEVIQGRPPEDGPSREGVADVTLRRQGVGIGDTVLFAGSEAPIRIVGFARDLTYQVQPTVWTSVDTWRLIRGQARPELSGDQTGVHALAVRLAGGADPEQVAALIDRTLSDVETVTQETAALSIPGVGRQRLALNAAIGATLGVAGLAVALFFALLTLEQRPLLAMLKALGASNTYLAGGVLAQALFASVAGLLLGGALAWLLSLMVPETVPALFRIRTAAILFIATLATGAIGAALSLRSVIRIDPASALGGTP